MFFIDPENTKGFDSLLDDSMTQSLDAFNHTCTLADPDFMRPNGI